MSKLHNHAMKANRLLSKITAIFLFFSIPLQAMAVNGFGSIAFGTPFSTVKDALYDADSFRIRTDPGTRKKFMSFRSSIYGLDSKVIIDFEDERVKSIKLDVENKSAGTLGNCRARFNTLFDKLKKDNKDFKVITNSQNFDGLVTENGYLIFETKRHIHMQMEFFSPECGITFLFSSVPPSFLAF